VAATPGYLVSLNAFVSKKTPKTRNRYGITGTTFVVAVEFGKKLKAKAILTGGISANPDLLHFTDQVEGYINHKYKYIVLYIKDVKNGAEKIYHPK
jgi:acyl-homoserine-lactone acylase